MQPKMTIPEIHSFLNDVFPQATGRFELTELGSMTATVRMTIDESDLRPGGTISGPAMFTLADCAFYMVTLAMIGPKALTVTTNCNINFMRKPEAKDLWARARILKLGRSLSVGDVELFSGESEKPVAHATMTYSIPPK